MKTWARILLVAGGSFVGLVLAEGVASLALGRSILRRESEPAAIPRTRMLDAERVALAAQTAGPYAADADPWVAMRLKGGLTTRFIEADVHTDERGQRVRVGPPPEPKAARIVVLGDSVAFGFGLRDDETIAQQIEGLLAPTMKDGAPRPVAFTVACPGWSFHNERRYLLDHLDELAPDVVLYIPVLNDLDDSFWVLETGHRWTDFDPAIGAARAHCSVNSYELLEATRRKRFPGAFPLIRNVYELYTGVTPESRRRYESVAQGLLEIDARCAARGAKLAILELDQQFYPRRVMQSLAARSSTIPWIAGIDKMTLEDQQETDAHPNARCARALAWRLARFLIERRWIPGAGERPLAPEDDRYVGRTAALPSAAELAAEAAAWDRANAENVNPKIDFGDGVGWHQIYGGVWPDGTVGQVAFCAIARSGGARVAVALDPVQDRPTLYPVRVRVAVQGKEVGAIEMPSLPRERVERAFAIPPELRAEPFLEVELSSSNWIVEVWQGVSRRASFRLASVASMP